MWTSRKKIMKMSQNFIAQIVLVVSMVYENQVHTKKVKKFSSVLSAKVIGTIYFQHIRLSSLKVDMKPTFFFNRWNYHLWSSQNETNKHKFSNLSCPLGPSIKYVSTVFTIFDTPSPCHHLFYLSVTFWPLPKKWWRILWMAPSFSSHKV